MIKQDVFLDGIKTLVNRDLLPVDSEGRPIIYVLEDSDGTYKVDSVRIQEFKTVDIIKEAKETRDTALESPIELDSVLFDIDVNARDNISIAIRLADRNNVPDTESRMWRLADNTWRETTLSELKQLLELYDSRFETIWGKYALWDSGDKSEKFEV